MKIDAVQVINERLTMQDVSERYGFTTNQKGFVFCPFHSEKTPSMKIYPGNGGFHCFGCGETGDVIAFVKKLFNLSFQETLRKMDTDFSLNIYGDHTFEEIQRSRYQQIALRAKSDRKKREAQKLEDDYWKAFDEWKRLYDNRHIYKPKHQGEGLHPLFTESLQKLDYQKYVLGLLDERRNA